MRDDLYITVLDEAEQILEGANHHSLSACSLFDDIAASINRYVLEDFEDREAFAACNEICHRQRNQGMVRHIMNIDRIARTVSFPFILLIVIVWEFIEGVMPLVQNIFSQLRCEWPAIVHWLRTGNSKT